MAYFSRKLEGVQLHAWESSLFLYLPFAGHSLIQGVKAVECKENETLTLTVSLNTVAEVRGQETKTGNEKQYFGYSTMPSERHTIQNQIVGWLVNDLEISIDIVEVLKC